MKNTRKATVDMRLGAACYWEDLAQETTLHNFGASAPDGSGPSGASLIFDAKGSLYGTTKGGGISGYGSAFEFAPTAGGGWTENVKFSSDATFDETIYYPTNGTAPTTTSTNYTGAITLSSTETIQTIAALIGVPSGIYNNISSVAVAAYTFNLPVPNFSIAILPTSLTVVGGQTGSATVSATQQNAFSAAVAFSCSGLPADATCAFSPQTVSPSGTASSTTTLTVTTSVLAASVRRSSRPRFPGSALAIAFCMIGRRKVQLLLVLTIGIAGLSLLSGCHGSSSLSTPDSSQRTTSVVTVTASSGSLQNTATFSLTVN